jgi:hypothetical protein
MRYVLTLTAVVALFLSAGCSIPLGPRDPGDKASTQAPAHPPPPPSFPNHGTMP